MTHPGASRLLELDATTYIFRENKHFMVRK